MSGPGQTLSCEYDRQPGCSEPWGIFEIAFVFRCLLSFVIVRGAFEGNECSVSIRPMKYEPLVPWKSESARAKLKGDAVKVPGGSGKVGLGPWCWVPGTGNIGRGPVQANLMGEVGVKGEVLVVSGVSYCLELERDPGVMLGREKEALERK